MDSPSRSAAADNEHTIVINVPEELLSSLRTTCAEKASVSLLGRIQGKHPGLKALTAWARETLHPSLSLLTLKANNLFEVTFNSIEGRTHALTQAELSCKTANITFSSWKPHANTQQDHDQLDSPIWVQVVDLCHILREENFLRTIGEHLGQVIAIDNSELYRAKLFGPRIRLLVKDLNNLPRKIAIPRLDGEGVAEYNLEYSGFPNQCGRCRSRDHQVRYCPKKDPKLLRKTQNLGTQHPLTTDHTPQEVSNTQNPVVEELIHPQQENNAETEETLAMDGPTPDPITNLSPPVPEPPNQTEEPDPPPFTENTEHPPELQPTEENFPQLHSPGKDTLPQTPKSQPPGTQQTYIWRQKPQMGHNTSEKGKEKLNMESTPITRQGYRSGRLSEDFWEVINIPGTPATSKKKLRVLPVLTKNFSHTEFLTDNSKNPHSAITTAHIAEVLAGVPWTLQRARQHIVNETTQALHKVLIFSNQHNTPFQKWEQGLWFAQWDSTGDGENICTLYVSIAAPEAKIRIRKGRNIGWRNITGSIKEALLQAQAETIQEVADLRKHWQRMKGTKDTNPSGQTTPTANNPFAALSDEDEQSS